MQREPLTFGVRVDIRFRRQVALKFGFGSIESSSSEFDNGYSVTIFESSVELRSAIFDNGNSVGFVGYSVSGQRYGS